MATEMILVPKASYERLVTDEKETHDKLTYYKTMLQDNGIDINDQGGGKLNEKSSTTSNSMVVVEEEESGGDKQTISNDVTYPCPMSVLAQLPSRYQFYGKRLLEYIEKHGKGKIGWGEDGSLIYNDVTIADTNIIDLVHHIFKKKKKNLMVLRN
jgi:hypothetical protein